MRNRLPQILVSIFFVALLATPLVLKRISNARRATLENVDAAGSLTRYGFRLEEAAKKSGIEFVHQAPTLDPRLNHIMPQIASMGAGVAVCDFDRDGWQDFYVSNSGENSLNRLYRNQKDGTFKDVAPALGVADVNKNGQGVSMGAVWGDYDNDGFEDLLVYKWGRPELFHNDGGKKFTRTTHKANLPRWVNANSAIWLDYDRDGRLDVFIAGYYNENLDLWHLKTTQIMPDSFEYARNGGRKYLLRNKGNGSFEDVTAKMGIDSRRWALAVTAADLRGTGYPDIFIANDYGVSEMFANGRGKGFREVGQQSFYWHKAKGIGPKSGMNASVGDVLNQGKFAIYVSNISESGKLIQGNNLWMPQPGDDGEVKYDNMANDMGVELGGWSFGAQFGDLNNDGALDLYLTNGYISGQEGTSYWYDYSKIAGAYSEIIADAKNWPPMKGQSLSGYQEKRVWLGNGQGRFTDVAQAVGVKDRFDGRSVAFADLSNTGAVDVIVANQRGPLLLYKNRVNPENAWVEFQLEGTKSNRSAIGAQVRVLWNGQQQVQEVNGGSGFCAQNQRRLHFGLGKNPRLEKVVVRWPSGLQTVLRAPRLNATNTLKEPA